MSAEDHPPVQQALAWLADYGDDLLRYALARVKQISVAEDLVQETFLAAIRGHGKFQQQSSLKTWLTGILRRKIADYYRRQVGGKEPLASPGDRTLFNESGSWAQRLGRWPREPSHTLENQEFWAVFHDCLAKLGPRVQGAFILRVLDERDSEDVCHILDISPTNLSVRLHRARLALRECLEKNWFDDHP